MLPFAIHLLFKPERDFLLVVHLPLFFQRPFSPFLARIYAIILLVPDPAVHLSPLEIILNVLDRWFSNKLTCMMFGATQLKLLEDGTCSLFFSRYRLALAQKEYRPFVPTYRKL